MTVGEVSFGCTRINKFYKSRAAQSFDWRRTFHKFTQVVSQVEQWRNKIIPGIFSVRGE